MSNAVVLENEQYVHTLARNMVLQQEYDVVCAAFDNAQIPVISLKGIALIQGMYPDSGERHIGDIDLCVKTEDYDRARQVLEALCYTTSPAYYDPAKYRSSSLRSFAFTKDTEIKFYIHLHWHVLNSALPLFMFPIDMDEIWKEAKWVKLEGRDLLMLAPHHEIVFLALHAFKHSYNKMSLFTDLKYAIEYYDTILDWHQVIACAEKWNAVIPLYCSLRLADKIVSLDTNVSLPRRWRRSIPWHICDEVINTVRMRVKNDQLATDDLVLPLILRIAGGVVAQAKYLVGSIFPFPRQLSQMYGVKLSPLIIFLYFKRIINIGSRLKG